MLFTGIMNILIDNTRTISDIQQEFSNHFPFLKIEFFSRGHAPAGATPKKLLYPAAKTIGECRSFRNSGSLHVNPSMTVAELEQTFSREYGLSVQVFRKSGRAWLETTLTDTWSLEKQNKQGEALSMPLQQEKPEEYDPKDD